MRTEKEGLLLLRFFVDLEFIIDAVLLVNPTFAIWMIALIANRNTREVGGELGFLVAAAIIKASFPGHAQPTPTPAPGPAAGPCYTELAQGRTGPWPCYIELAQGRAAVLRRNHNAGPWPWLR